MKKNSYLTVTDQFCGCGGSSSGVKRYSDAIGGGNAATPPVMEWIVGQCVKSLAS